MAKTISIKDRCTDDGSLNIFLSVDLTDIE